VGSWKKSAEVGRHMSYLQSSGVEKGSCIRGYEKVIIKGFKTCYFKIKLTCKG